MALSTVALCREKDSTGMREFTLEKGLDRGADRIEKESFIS